MSIVNSTISHNIAGRDGGGAIFRHSGGRHIRHSTIAFNLVDTNNLGPRFAGANHPAGGEHKGAGVQNDPGVPLSLYHVAFQDNARRASLAAGGIADDVTGEVFSEGWNLFAAPSVNFVAGTGGADRFGAYADLAPLADNGGGTPTHLLGAKSEARDAGALSSQLDAGVPTSDQRGAPRVHADRSISVRLRWRSSLPVGGSGRCLRRSSQLQTPTRSFSLA